MVGLVGTMSGTDAWRGSDAFEGADLGVHSLNRGRREDDPVFELVTLDDRGDPARAQSLVAQLVAGDTTVGIVYAGPPEGLARSAGVLAETGIPALLTSGDLFSPRLLRGPLYQVAPPLLWQARRLVWYFARDRDYAAAGALIERGLDGDTAAESLRAIARAARMRLVVVRYQPGTLDLAAGLARLRQARVEAVIVHGAPGVLTEVAGRLEGTGSTYIDTPSARIGSAPGAVRRRRRSSGYWHPQLGAFDLGLEPAPPQDLPPPGTVAAESYVRGAHYLPIPSLETFRREFEDWWSSMPYGREQRAYEAARLIGWAAMQPGPGPIAGRLIGVAGLRVGGLDIGLDEADHVTAEEPAVGLWTIPAPPDRVRERDELPPTMPWVPLARSFALNGKTSLLPADWRYLIAGAPEPDSRRPAWGRQLFGIVTGPRDRFR